MRRKCLFMLLVLVIGLFNSLEIKGESDNDYIIRNQGNYLEIKQNRHDKLVRDYETMRLLGDLPISEIESLVSDGRRGYLSGYPNYQQSYGYYCGPANIKQAIQYINGSSLSQDAYANHMGTSSSSGTYVYKMKNEMNYRQSTFTYTYQLIDTSNTNLVWTAILQNTLNNKPTILHANTGSLYLYNGTSLGHYITAIGFFGMNDTSVEKEIDYIDTYSNNYGRGTTLGMHTDTLSNIEASLMNRYIIY